MKVLKKLADIWKHFETILMVVLFVIAFITIVLQIVTRYVFNSPFKWTDELASLMQPVMAFVTLCYGLRTNTHTRVNVLSKKFPLRVNNVINFIAYILFAYFCVKMVIVSIPFIKIQWYVLLGTMPKLMHGYFYIAFPICFTIAAIYTAMAAFDEVRKFAKKPEIFNIKPQEGWR